MTTISVECECGRKSRIVARGIDPYASSLPVLFELMCRVKPYTVAEHGCGYYSTGLFCADARRLVSFHEDMDPGWASKIMATYPRAVAVLKEGFAWRLKEWAELVYIDGGTGARAKWLQVALSGYAKVVVAHDWEDPAYGWANVPFDFNRWRVRVHKEFRPWTAVFERKS
jgi:hypothetical protein